MAFLPLPPWQPRVKSSDPSCFLPGARWPLNRPGRAHPGTGASARAVSESMAAADRPQWVSPRPPSSLVPVSLQRAAGRESLRLPCGWWAVRLYAGFMRVVSVAGPGRSCLRGCRRLQAGGFAPRWVWTLCRNSSGWDGPGFFPSVAVGSARLSAGAGAALGLSSFSARVYPSREELAAGRHWAGSSFTVSWRWRTPPGKTL
jgi:hypothetical protein